MPEPSAQAKAEPRINPGAQAITPGVDSFVRSNCGDCAAGIQDAIGKRLQSIVSASTKAQARGNNILRKGMGYEGRDDVAETALVRLAQEKLNQWLRSEEGKTWLQTDDGKRYLSLGNDDSTELTADGKYGIRTELVVCGFQAAHKLQVDGMVGGWQTLPVLMPELYPSAKHGSKEMGATAGRPRMMLAPDGRPPVAPTGVEKAEKSITEVGEVKTNLSKAPPQKALAQLAVPQASTPRSKAESRPAVVKDFEDQNRKTEEQVVASPIDSASEALRDYSAKIFGKAREKATALMKELRTAASKTAPPEIPAVSTPPKIPAPTDKELAQLNVSKAEVTPKPNADVINGTLNALARSLQPAVPRHEQVELRTVEGPLNLKELPAFRAELASGNVNVRYDGPIADRGNVTDFPVDEYIRACAERAKVQGDITFPTFASWVEQTSGASLFLFHTGQAQDPVRACNIEAIDKSAQPIYQTLIGIGVPKDGLPFNRWIDIQKCYIPANDNSPTEFGQQDQMYLVPKETPIPLPKNARIDGKERATMQATVTTTGTLALEVRHKDSGESRFYEYDPFQQKETLTYLASRINIEERPGEFYDISAGKWQTIPGQTATLR